LNKNVIKFNNDPYIISEIGINHNGYLSLVKKLIKSSVLAGANAVKFQKRDVNDLVNDQSKLKKAKGYLSKHENDINHKSPKFGAWTYPDTRLELSEKDYKEIKSYCSKLKIDLIVTPWDETSVDFLLKLGVKYLKIASIDAVNYHFCEYVAKKKKPTIISTGMSTYEEILKTQRIFNKFKTPHIFLHCTSAYPSTNLDKNLKCIPKLSSLLNEDVGFSGHGIGSVGAAGAVALGAKVVEKHVTLSRKMLGPDHAASLEFGEFTEMVNLSRGIKEALGSDQKKFLKSEKVLHDVLIRKFVTRKNVKKSEKINFNNVKTAVTYSKKGILPKNYLDILGKKFNKNIKANTIINLKDIKF
jgi:N,N'-diacetyllegionaminate synthase